MLQTGLTAEAVTRAAADAGLQTALAGEVTNRTAAVATVQANLDSEVQARSSAVMSEATARMNADLQINQRIAVDEASRVALGQSLLSEGTARVAADMAISNRIDGVSGRVAALENNMARLDNKIASGTAVAVAMGGAAFLPDTHFNLTANVASYEGARAGSLQLGALISSHVALNAGVAGGFNRGGKTAVRVGVTLGW